jgi:riboflavin kinase / FMN adenylyltransferase
MQVLNSYDELKHWASAPLALTVGFFDGVHSGHQHLLSRLRAQAEQLGAQSLVVTFSNSPRAFHQHAGEWRYITLPEEKLAMLAETGVDATLMLEYTQAIADQTGEGFIRDIGEQAQLVALCMGYDTSIGKEMLRGELAFEELARRLHLALDYVEPYARDGAPVKSSSARSLIAAGDVAGARSVLGHPYFVIGRVGAGKGKGGKELHAPTANIYLPREKIVPPAGVYAGLAEAGGRVYPAAVVVLSDAQAHNTVVDRDAQAAGNPGDPAQMIIEAHLIGYAGDLYGAPLTVRFIQHIREFRDFGTVGELVAQIQRDIAMVREAVAQEPALSATKE